MSDSDLRFHALDQIVRTFLDSIYENERDLYLLIKYNDSALKAAVEDYYESLAAWKKYFNVPDVLDRHKVAALTVHYFLKYRPISLLKDKPRLPILLFANELLAWHIGISRLENCGRVIRPENPAYASYLRLARDHMQYLNTPNYAEYEGHAIRHWSVFMYLMERNNLLLSAQ